MHNHALGLFHSNRLGISYGSESLGGKTNSLGRSAIPVLGHDLNGLLETILRHWPMTAMAAWVTLGQRR